MRQKLFVLYCGAPCGKCKNGSEIRERITELKKVLIVRPGAVRDQYLFLNGSVSMLQAVLGWRHMQVIAEYFIEVAVITETNILGDDPDAPVRSL